MTFEIWLYIVIEALVLYCIVATVHERRSTKSKLSKLLNDKNELTADLAICERECKAIKEANRKAKSALEYRP